MCWPSCKTRLPSAGRGGWTKRNRKCCCVKFHHTLPYRKRRRIACVSCCSPLRRGNLKLCCSWSPKAAETKNAARNSSDRDGDIGGESIGRATPRRSSGSNGRSVSCHPISGCQCPPTSRRLWPEQRNAARGHHFQPASRRFVQARAAQTPRCFIFFSSNSFVDLSRLTDARTDAAVGRVRALASHPSTDLQ